MSSCDHQVLINEFSAFAESHKHSGREKLELKKMDEYEVERDDLFIDEDAVLGAGVAAKVYKGVLRRCNPKLDSVEKLEVAIKMAHPFAKVTVK